MEIKDKKYYSSLKSKESRKLKSKSKRFKNIWFGLGFIGLIGWTVVLPMLAGILLGKWLDKHYQAKYSWTLALLVAGLLIGCFNAWRWINKENNEIQKEQEDNNE